MEKDLYQEHSQHNTYQEDCSTCYSENKTLKNSEVDYNAMMKNKYGSNYPAGVNPNTDF